MKTITPKTIKRRKVYTTYVMQTGEWSLEDIWYNLTSGATEIQDLKFEVAGVRFKASFREQLEYWGSHPDGGPSESIRVSLNDVVLLEGLGLWWPCLTCDAFVAKVCDGVNSVVNA